MLSLLAEIYNTFSEQSDTDKPELVLFIEETHLIFNEARKILLNQELSIIKLIRSKNKNLFYGSESH
jgi:DNA helicase HerA-like ATPase